MDRLPGPATTGTRRLAGNNPHTAPMLSGGAASQAVSGSSSAIAAVGTASATANNGQTSAPASTVWDFNKETPDNASNSDYGGFSAVFNTLFRNNSP